MASREYSTVSYHATKDDTKESIPEVLMHDAKDRENSEGIGELFLNYKSTMSYFIFKAHKSFILIDTIIGDSLSQHSESTTRDSRDDDIKTANTERDEFGSRWVY